ncbi:MAG: SDR family oxidoreductase [Deltaproteobacteria bacterium]|nr:SDR family oxidoreductase [Deltaproteobacteria bacterium]
MALLLHEKVAVVTGASSGIGAATAKLLGREGARVVLAARREAELEAVADSLREAGTPALTVKCDLSNEVEVVSLVGRALDSFGGLDILVNAAGIAAFGEVAHGRTAEWRAMLEVNALGLSLLSREVAAVMMEAHKGDIVNLACRPGQEPYCSAFYDATKAFVLAFSDKLRREVRTHGIRVMTIIPGAVQTGLGAGAPGLEEHRVGIDALHPEDVAEAIMHALIRPRRITYEAIELVPTLEEEG